VTEFQQKVHQLLTGTARRLNLRGPTLRVLRNTSFEVSLTGSALGVRFEYELSDCAVFAVLHRPAFAADGNMPLGQQSQLADLHLLEALRRLGYFVDEKRAKVKALTENPDGLIPATKNLAADVEEFWTVLESKIDVLLPVPAPR